jgi:TnpA family transposase
VPRRSILSAAERESLVAIPVTNEELIRHYTLSEPDHSLVRQRRGEANRLGFAVQLCLLRYPGTGLPTEISLPESFLDWLATEIRVDPSCWPGYSHREETRREHLLELRTYLDLKPFGLSNFRQSIQTLTDLAMQTDKGIVLAAEALDAFRKRRIIIPHLDVVDRVCSEAITRANRRIYAILTESLSTKHRKGLDELFLQRTDEGNLTRLAWLRQAPVKPNSRHMLEHIERLKTLQALDLPLGIDRLIHQNRLLKMAREGNQTTPADLARFEPQRRYATLVVVVVEAMATVIDEIIDLHDRILGKLFNEAQKKHHQIFQDSGKSINDKVRLFGLVGQILVDAKENNSNPLPVIEAMMPWDEFAASVAEAQKLAQPDDFDFLRRIGDSYAMLRRYAPEFLSVLNIQSTSAESLLRAIATIQVMNSENARKVPDDAPTEFVKQRWKKLVFSTDGSIDRRYYELCALSELKNALRSGDVWVQGSRQFKNFDEYLVPIMKFTALQDAKNLPVSVDTDCEKYLNERLSLLEQQMETVNRLATSKELPEAIMTESGLKITPLDAAVPETAQKLIERAAVLLPRVKITELLLEVDQWTDFTRHFTHLKSGDLAKDKTLLLTTILADGINIGLSKMAEACAGTTYAKLQWLQAWHIRDETYSTALAELVNAQSRQAFAENWGDGTTSSSDGQRFKVGGRAESSGHINPKYGAEPGRLFYTHISDQYSPFSVKMINVGVRDSTYVLDGLLYHESDLRIEEHYTDTAGFTDHVFGLMHLLGFRFAPRIRGLGDTKLFTPKAATEYEALKPMIGVKLNVKSIRDQWDEILRLATSIKQGTVTASLMLRKLGSYSRQNGLAVALREFGRIERTLFILEWLQSVELRRRVQVGLNKGEARNALARAVFFYRLGEIRDRSFEQQHYRASGLNLVTAAIVLWNTVYLERATNFLRASGTGIDENLLQYLSPLGWEHINLAGDYHWRSGIKPGMGEFRPLRPVSEP